MRLCACGSGCGRAQFRCACRQLRAGGRYLIVHHNSVHHNSVDPRAIAEVPTAPAFFSLGSFGSYVPAPREPETDGLSRNRDDCVKYGCIDNGGG